MTSIDTQSPRSATFVAIAIDVLLAVVLGAVALLILAGPAIYEPFGVRLKLRTADNPVTIALALAFLRVWFFPSIRVLGFAYPPTSLQRLHEALAGSRVSLKSCPRSQARPDLRRRQLRREGTPGMDASGVRDGRRRRDS